MCLKGSSHCPFPSRPGARSREADPEASVVRTADFICEERARPFPVSPVGKAKPREVKRHRQPRCLSTAGVPESGPDVVHGGFCSCAGCTVLRFGILDLGLTRFIFYWVTIHMASLSNRNWRERFFPCPHVPLGSPGPQDTSGTRSALGMAEVTVTSIRPSTASPILASQREIQAAKLTESLRIALQRDHCASLLTRHCRGAGSHTL